MRITGPKSRKGENESQWNSYLYRKGDWVHWIQESRYWQGWVSSSRVAFVRRGWWALSVPKDPLQNTAELCSHDSSTSGKLCLGKGKTLHRQRGQEQKEWESAEGTPRSHKREEFQTPELVFCSPVERTVPEQIFILQPTLE